MKIDAIMSKPVQTCGPDTNIGSVVETMWTHNCGIVPVVNERGEAIGVVTDRDVCIALGTRDVQASELVARNVMTQPVVGCAPADDCVAALLTMEEHHVRRLPVLGSGGVLLGIVSIDDIVRWAARAPESDPLRAVVVQVLAGWRSRHETPTPGHAKDRGLPVERAVASAEADVRA